MNLTMLVVEVVVVVVMVVVAVVRIYLTRVTFHILWPENKQ